MNSIPAELQLSIAEQLDPISSFNFAITCKDLWELCKSVIATHARLLAENQAIDTLESPHLIWDKLRDILGDPRRGWYVRELNLPSDRQNFWDPNVAHHVQVTHRTLRLLDEDIELFTSAARAVERLYIQLANEGSDYKTGDVERWIPVGSDEPIIAILIHHLPYLSVLRFTDLDLKGTFYNLMRHIAISYGDPAKTHLLPFQHLTTVAVAHWDSEFYCDAEWCYFIIRIPSLRHFIAMSMGGNLREVQDEPIDPNSRAITVYPQSNVKELLFINSQFDVRGLGKILGGIKHLEQFSYESGGGIVDYSSFNPKRVIKALVDRQGHSLKHLTLDYSEDAGDEEDLTSISLRDFQKLKTLRCDWRMIWPETLDDDCQQDEELPDGGFYTEDKETLDSFDIRTLLPESLEELHIYGLFDDDEWERMNKLIEGQSKLTPNLSKIYIESTETDQYRVKKTEAGESLPRIYDNPLRTYLDGHGYT